MGDLSAFVKTLKQRYSMSYNGRYARKGTLWEDRFKSVLVENAIDAKATVAAYIDLNPVRAGMVPASELYPWSSHCHYIGLRNDKWLTPHPLLWSLGNTPFAREAAYVCWMDLGTRWARIIGHRRMLARLS